MCGIVGMAGSIGQKDKSAFENMFVFSQVRGPHSSGVASVDRYLKERHVLIVKDVGRPDVLIDYSKQYDKVVDYNKKFMLGHNRWATTGKINKRNAHPFALDNIVGCHNGTVHAYDLKDVDPNQADYGTDSECILANIDKRPLAEVMLHMIGAWALVWYDDRDNTLNMLRNKERTLSYCYSDTRKTIYFASEPGFITVALDRNGLSHGKMYDLPADIHYKWELPGNQEILGQPEQVEIKSGVAVPRRGFHRQLFPEKASAEIIDISKGALKSGTAGTTTYQNNYDVKKFEIPINLKGLDGQGYLGVKGKDTKLYRGYRGEVMNKTLFENATHGGCSWCTQPAEWGKPVRFISATEHICMDCNTDGQVRELYNVS